MQALFSKYNYLLLCELENRHFSKVYFDPHFYLTNNFSIS